MTFWRVEIDAEGELLAAGVSDGFDDSFRDGTFAFCIFEACLAFALARAYSEWRLAKAIREGRAECTWGDGGLLAISVPEPTH